MNSDEVSYEQSGYRKLLDRDFIKRNIIRGFKFVIAGGAGFILAEALLLAGILIAGEGNLLAINIVAAALSVAGGFVINEYWTSRNEGDHSGRKLGFAIRLFKFELVYALGNAISIGVQLFLFYRFGIYPVLGNIAGAIVALPVNYFISMVAVWRIRL